MGAVTSRYLRCFSEMSTSLVGSIAGKEGTDESSERFSQKMSSARGSKAFKFGLLRFWR